MSATQRVCSKISGTVAVAALLAMGAGPARAGGPPATIVIPPSSAVKPEDVGHRFHTSMVLMVRPGGLAAAAGTPQSAPVLDTLVETPPSLACAYRLVTAVPGCNPTEVSTNPTGGKHAIAVVEAYDYADPHGVSAAANDLAVFDKVFGIPSANFSVIFGTGSPSAGCTNGTTKPPPAAGTGWDLEQAVDIEWAHAMAPSAKLYLVEANSNSTSDLLNAVAVATKCVQSGGGGQVSMGWGTPEFSGESADDGTFTGVDVVYFAAGGEMIPSGFVPYPVSYPAASPNVIGVGGTTFSRNHGDYQSQATWNVNYSLIGILYGTGGGPSAFEKRPAYQNGIAKIVGTARGTPDLAALADPDNAVWIYNSTYSSSRGEFIPVGGTAVATAITAGIANELGLFYPSSQAALTAIYGNTGKVRTEHVTDINSGLCGPPGSSGLEEDYSSPYDPNYIEATTGINWDWCSGWGSLHGSK